MKVLIVDDEAPIRQWLEYCVSHIPNFSFVSANSGKAGIEQYQIHHPDIVISDIEMPGMNGLEMLKTLQEYDPNLYSIVLTSHEDFTYARTALNIGTADYILKTEITEDSLRNVLDNAKSLIEEIKIKTKQAKTSIENYIQMLIHNSSIDIPSMEDLQNIGINLNDESYIVITIQQNEIDYSILENHNELQNLIKVPLGTNKTIYIANLIIDYNLLIEKIKKISIDNNIVSIGLSNVYNDIQQLKQALIESNNRCALSFYSNETKVFYIDELNGFNIQEEVFNAEFTKLLLNQDFSEAYELLCSTLEEVTLLKPIDIDRIKKLTNTSVSSFLYFYGDSTENADIVVSNIKDIINNANNIEILKEQIEYILSPIVQMSNSTANLTLQIRNAIEYIEQHYFEKISLSSLAENIGFSSEYFSRLFRKETGINFVTYLNNIRMKHAIELLETTDMKVYEIADKVGFTTLSYFSTAFKKKFGQNPYEYQINYQRGKLKSI